MGVKKLYNDLILVDTCIGSQEQVITNFDFLHSGVGSFCFSPERSELPEISEI